MFKDDKVGIGCGILGLFQDPRFVSLDEKTKKWTFHADVYRKYIIPIKEAGVDFIRWLAYGVWGAHKFGKLSQFQPYVLKKVSSTVELWDLSERNDYYEPIVNQAKTVTNEENMTVVDCLFDNCQFHGTYKRWSPWANNIQGITTFYGKDADEFTKPWISTRIKNNKGFDVIHSAGNELNNRTYPAFFERVIVPFIKAKKLDVNRLTYGATNDPIQDAVRDIASAELGGSASRSIILEYHGWSPVSFPKDARVMYSDDGFYGGLPNCDEDTWVGGSRGYRPSPAEWGVLVKGILAKYASSAPGRPRLLSFEHLPANDYLNPDCQALWFKAISAAYFKKFKVWPKNYRFAANDYAVQAAKPPDTLTIS